MTTVLLWGDRWWLPHHRLPIPFAAQGQAAAMLAAAWPANGRTIRLIYQPADFASVPVDCPNGNRATLAAALAEEHPVVLHPGHVWSHEPIMGTGEGFSTLLHYESRPALFALVQQLEESGFNVASAWPLSSWLTSLPPELSDSGAMTLVALHADRYCIYRHSPAGVRSVHTGQGENVLSAVAERLQPVFAQSPGEFVLFVTTDDAFIDALNEKLTPATNQVVGLFMLWEALAKAAPLPSKHPAQLLPDVPKVSAARVVTAAAVLLLALAGASAALQVREHLASRQDSASRSDQAAALRTEIGHLRENAAEIGELRAVVQAAGQRPPVGILLREISALPPEIALASLRVTAEGFVLAGGVVPGGGEAAAGWTSRFGRAGLPWEVPAKAPAAVGILRLAGKFRS
jgi:hypothetical protein